MGFIVHFSLQFGRDVGVDGGGGERRVAEEHLDRFEVHAMLEPMGGDGVADGVGGDPFREAASLEVGGKMAIDGAGGEASAPLVEEDRLGVLFVSSGVAEIAEDPVGCSLRDGGLSLLFPFAKDVEEEIFGIEIGAVEAGELAEAEP